MLKKVPYAQDPNIPDQICIHHSGWEVWKTREQWTIESIKKYHMEKREARDIGYHFIIDLEGQLHVGRPVTMCPMSSRGHNQDVIAICVMGNFNYEYPSEAQINRLKFLLLELCQKYLIPNGVGQRSHNGYWTCTDMSHIFGHGDYRDPSGNRRCPGKNLHRQIKDVSHWVNNALEKGIKVNDN